MKRAGKILGVLLLLAVAASGCRHFRHEKEDRNESKKMNKMMVHNFRHRGMGRNSDSYMMRGMRPGMRRGMGMMNNDNTGWNQMGRGAGNGMGQMGRGAGRGMGQMGHGAGRGMGQMNGMDNSPVGPGGIILQNIPNVTDKQKKEFAELLKSQQDEMTKMRSEMAAKIRSTIESQRTKMLKLFTEEQKKSISAR